MLMDGNWQYLYGFSYMNNYKGQERELILLAMWILENFQYYNIYNDVPARKIIKIIVDDFFYCTFS